MPRCHHVVCALCAESTVRYWRECPVCFTFAEEGAKLDPILEEVLKWREAEWHAKQSLQTLGVPAAARAGSAAEAVSVWQGRLESACKERERTCRIVVEYGCLVRMDGSAARSTWYTRVGELQVGPRSGFNWEGGPVVEMVTINTTPGGPQSADGTLTSPNDIGQGFAVHRAGVVPACHVTIYWKPALGLAPLLIKAVAAPLREGVGTWKGWLVVQLPMVGTTRSRTMNTGARSCPSIAIFSQTSPIASSPAFRLLILPFLPADLFTLLATHGKIHTFTPPSGTRMRPCP